MLSRTLQQLVNQNLTTAREISELTGVAPSTVYRWINGRCEPDFNAIRLLLRHLPNRAAQEAILTAFVAGTPWRMTLGDGDLDVNHDGSVNGDDALDATIAAACNAAEALKEVRAATQRSPITPEQALHAIRLLNDVARTCSVSQQVLVQLADQREQRRKLKLVP